MNRDDVKIFVDAINELTGMELEAFHQNGYVFQCNDGRITRVFIPNGNTWIIEY